MDDADLGVTLSVTSLIMALVQDNPEAYRTSYVKAAHRLKRVVVNSEYTQDYMYYKVPCPWIQVKLLRLLQYYPPSGQHRRSNRSMRKKIVANLLFDTQTM